MIAARPALQPRPALFGLCHTFSLGVQAEPASAAGRFQLRSPYPPQPVTSDDFVRCVAARHDRTGTPGSTVPTYGAIWAARMMRASSCCASAHVGITSLSMYGPAKTPMNISCWAKASAP